MSFGLADGVASAFSEASVDALVVDTGAAVGAFFVGLTFTADTVGEGVSGVARWAGAHRSFALSSVESWSANGVLTAGVRLAEILGNKFAAADEGIASHVTWAGADWSQSTEVAVGVDTAGSVAWVLADSVETGWFRSGTVNVSVALWAALDRWISEVVLWTFANSAVIDDSRARRALSAECTRFNTFVGG